jgi:hypothetical protein
MLKLGAEVLASIFLDFFVDFFWGLFSRRLKMLGEHGGAPWSLAARAVLEVFFVAFFKQVKLESAAINRASKGLSISGWVLFVEPAGEKGRAEHFAVAALFFFCVLIYFCCHNSLQFCIWDKKLKLRMSLSSCCCLSRAGLGLRLSEQQEGEVVRPSYSLPSPSPSSPSSVCMVSVSKLRQMESVSSSSVLLPPEAEAEEDLMDLAALADLAAAAFSFFLDTFFARGTFTFLEEGGARNSLCRVEFQRFLIALSVRPGNALAISAHLLPCSSCCYQLQYMYGVKERLD